MAKKYLSEGIHVLADLFGISNNLLDNGEFLEKILRKACELSGATVLSVDKRKFDPAGYTVLLGLSESHISIHTYVNLDNEDDLGECFLDFFTCGLCDPLIGVTYIVNQMCSELSNVHMKVLKRGLDGGIVDLNEMCDLMC